MIGVRGADLQSRSAFAPRTAIIATAG